MAKEHLAYDPINVEDLGVFLESWYKLSMEEPEQTFCPMLVSSPGIGKTSVVKQLADKHGVKVFNLILSQANPSEVAGMVMPAPDGSHRTHIYDPQWVHELNDGDILFLDEVLKAPQATLNSCLTMIQERRMASGTKLPKIAIIAAANYNKQALSYAPELKQRFQAVDVKFDFGVWSKYMVAKYEWIPDETALTVLSNAIYPEVDGARWNQMSPRDTEKMLVWANKTYHDDDEAYEDALCFMCNMYGGSVSNTIKSCIDNIFNRNLSARRRQLESVLMTNGHKFFVKTNTHLDDTEFCKKLVQCSWFLEDGINELLMNLQAVDEVEVKEDRIYV